MPSFFSNDVASRRPCASAQTTVNSNGWSSAAKVWSSAALIWCSATETRSSATDIWSLPAKIWSSAAGNWSSAAEIGSSIAETRSSAAYVCGLVDTDACCVFGGVPRSVVLTVPAPWQQSSRVLACNVDAVAVAQVPGERQTVQVVAERALIDGVHIEEHHQSEEQGH